MKADLAKTSDGISMSDWDAVKHLAAECANACTDSPENGNVAALRKKMLRLLNRLSARYGERPSILATKADYVISDKKRAYLLENAFHLATQNNDHKNITMISSSLAEFYAEDMGDLRKGQMWLDRLANALLEHPDLMEQRVHERIKRIITNGHIEQPNIFSKSRRAR